jgi:hypothetical protein
MTIYFVVQDGMGRTSLKLSCQSGAGLNSLIEKLIGSRIETRRNTPIYVTVPVVSIS